MDSRENDTYQQQFESIENKAQILSLLNQCAKQHSDLHISLSRHGELFNTQIEHVDETQQCMYLAELLPKLGQRLLRGSKKLRIFTHVNGAEINFEVNILRVKSALFRTRNCVEFPKLIRYFQRRRAHRIHISMAMDIKASLNTHSGNNFQGQIRDLSSTGMRVQFYSSKPKELEQQPLPQECVIALPDDENIRCHFTVHHLHKNENDRGFAVGGSFSSMNQEQKKMLQRFLARVERETLRAYR